MSHLQKDIRMLHRATASLRPVFNARTVLNPDDDGPEHDDLLAAVLDMLRGRKDVVLIGGQAVNVYAEPRGTADVDFAADSPSAMVKLVCRELARRFGIRLTVKHKKGGYSIYREREPPAKRQKVADVRAAPAPSRAPVRMYRDTRVLAPDELTVSKVLAYARRRATRKGDLDRADLRGLLQLDPDRRVRVGALLRARRVPSHVWAAWQDVANAPVDDEEE